MAKLKLKGNVVHPAGFWGINRPVKGASVEIVDIDAPGRTNDVIWKGTTNASGAFQGESSEWKDTIILTPAVPGTPFSPGIPAVTGSDPADVLMLQIIVSQSTPAGQKQVTLPFAFLGDNVAGPPIVVTWAPLDPVVKVNGAPCYSPNDVQSNVKSAIDTNASSISIDVYGPDANTLIPLTQPPAQLKQWILQQRGQVQGLVDPPSWAVGTFVILIGVAILCLAIGATAVLLAIGIAIILAVAMGYRTIKVEQKTDAQGQNYIHFELQKS